jgi:TRAP-type C4-dicarboxylate transport system substrate-binding protein
MHRLRFLGLLYALSLQFIWGQEVAPSYAATLGPGPKVSISLVAQSIPTLLQYSKVEVPYAKEIIPQRSNDRVEVRVSTWSEMNLTGNEIIRLTRQGQVEIGGAPLTYVAGDVPLLDAADLAGLNPTLEQTRTVMEALMPIVNKELERFGVKIIGSFPFPAQVFYCRAPVKDLADLKGRKIRTFGTSLNDLVVALGAQAVSITFAEVYTALERGVADCGITGTGSGNAAKWYEVTTHLYTLPVGWSLAAYYVNLSWWNKLAPDVRAFFEATFKEMENKLWDLGADLTQDGIDCNAGRPTCRLGTPDKDSPMAEVKPIEADKARLRTILEEAVIPSWVKRCGERCGEIYNQVVAPISGVKYVKR